LQLKRNLSALAAWHHAVGQARLIKNALRLAWPKETKAHLSRYGQLRLSETIPESVKKLDRLRIPLRSYWNPSERIPKVTRFKDTTVALLHQEPSFDASAILKHLSASPLPSHAPSCEYLVDGITHILDKNTFMNMCNSVSSTYGWPIITEHSFRIDGTTSLLVSGVDPSVVKKMGRWSSDAYLRYWRTVEEVFHLHASNLSFKNYDI
jgi:hypothetical protein